MISRVSLDRAAAVRDALCRLVARHGFHGASMGAVAREAGVATGTTYVHYASKEDLVYAAYLWVKRELGDAATAALDPAAPPRARFEHVWLGAYRHLAADPDRAKFLTQVDSSPYAEIAHARAMAVDGDPLLAVATSPDMAALMVPLPPAVLYDLAIGPIVRITAAERDIDPADLPVLVESCWRAVTLTP